MLKVKYSPHYQLVRMQQTSNEWSLSLLRGPSWAWSYGRL